jgi:hypothetical protein
VGQHGAFNYIANGINPFNAGFQMIVNGNLAAAFFNGKANVF